MKVNSTLQRNLLEDHLEDELRSISKEIFDKELEKLTDYEVYVCVLELVKEMGRSTTVYGGPKKVYYISMEFLIGRLLSCNLINIGIYDKLKLILDGIGKDINEIIEQEPEPSLGNGGLGRLAACFLDSMASIGIPGDGIGLNYHYGLFKQSFKEGLQYAEKNPWIEQNSWLKKRDHKFQVRFGLGTVTSVLYDIDVIGYKNGVNRLHLFDIESVDESLVEEGIDFDKTAIEKNLTLFLYPDDSDEEGNLLRIYQEYFLVSNAAQYILMEMKEQHTDLRKLSDHVVIQINDTHPSMIIPELIRILVEDKAFSIDEAIEVVSKTCAYTNHTILAEALEKWPIAYLEKVVPQLIPYINELDKKIKKTNKNGAVAIIDKKKIVHMAHMDIHYGFSINGVAEIHTKILKETELNEFYKLYPEKFNNKTNGITFRRWLYSCNRELTTLIEDTIGDSYRKDAFKLEKLNNYKDNEVFLTKLDNVKKLKKQQLAKYIHEKEGIEINPDSIFDVQIKRLHEYKRQQMNALYIIHKYLEIKSGKKPERGITFIFGAKAAPAYVIAKDIIHLILCLQKLIENDSDVNKYIKVVMVENYNVSYAEKLVPAADISEQISLASKEASGTGNMKLMLNGAVTIGTMDGANVEIYDHVGQDNIYIFGQDADSVINHYKNKDYISREYYEKSKVIKAAVDFIISKPMLKIGHKENLRRLYDELLKKDWFMTLLDFEDYIRVKDKMLSDYENREKWMKMMLKNIAMAGFFSSDRTIEDYNRDIWHL